MRTPPPLITAFFRAGFLSVPCISQKISQIHFSFKETYLGSTGLFEGVEVFQRTATVRTPRSVDISSADLSISKAERSKAPVSGRCLFFLYFSVFFLYVDAAPGFLRGLEGRARARRQRTRRLLSPCGVSTRSRRSLRTRIERTKRPRAESSSGLISACQRG